MRLPLKTEYACQVLAQLASTHAEGGVRQVEELAQAEALSPNYLVQILTTLRQAGLVLSRRGKNGGYLLARHPSSITLADVAAAMEGGALIESNPSNGGHSANRVREAWNKVNDAIMKSCEEVTLIDLAPPPPPGVGEDWVI